MNIKKIKTRLLWFGVGILVGGAAISHFVFRGLRSDRYAFVYEVRDLSRLTETINLILQYFTTLNGFVFSPADEAEIGCFGSQSVEARVSLFAEVEFRLGNFSS